MKKPILELVIAGTVTTIALSITALAYQITKQPESVFVEKTTVIGLPGVEGVTSFEELDEATVEWAEARLQELVTLESERGVHELPLASLGLSVDWEKWNLVEAMQEAGPLEKLKIFVFGQTLQVPLSIDNTLLESTLAATGIEQTAASAHLLVTEDGSLSIAAGQMGYAIQRDIFETQMQRAFLTNENTLPLDLVVSEPEVQDAELLGLIPVIQPLLGKEITLQDEFGNTWVFALSEHLDLIKPVPSDGVAVDAITDWTLDETGFITYAESTLVPEVEQEPTSVVITEEVVEGVTKYHFEGSARFGKELDKLGLLDLVLERIQNPPNLPESEIAYADEPIALPVNRVDPLVTVPESLAAKGVTGLVGMGYSDFSGSPGNRIHNIQAGIDQFNGVLIEQNAEFSFMGHMTPVDAEHGFLPELVIKGDETIPEYGGGLCQISSTLFRAALYSGLPITARRNHSYAVSYYARPFGYGLDATVYDPAPDLKFVNDTAGALLVQAYTEGSSAYYVFYGTSDDRTVSMEGPYAYNYNSISEPVVTMTDKLAPGVRELKEYGHTGFTVDWYRTVVYPEGSLSPYAATASGVRENIHSVYEARPAKYWEGAATSSSSDS